MDSLISRQAAIDVVSDALKRVFVEHRGIAEKLLGKLPSTQSEPRWIPVEEELPKEGERVLVMDSDGTIEIADYIKYARYYGIEWWSHDYQVHPIAWMPLPKPYERSEE